MKMLGYATQLVIALHCPTLQFLFLIIFYFLMPCFTPCEMCKKGKEMCCNIVLAAKYEKES